MIFQYGIDQWMIMIDYNKGDDEKNQYNFNESERKTCSEWEYKMKRLINKTFKRTIYSCNT